MKPLFLLIAILCLGGAAMAQNVVIPDTNFKALLVADSNINTNGDSEIQVAEAAAYTGGIQLLGFLNNIVHSTSGLEAFTSLTSFYCDFCWMADLDISHNTALTTLEIRNSTTLHSLDISHNTALVSLTLGSLMGGGLSHLNSLDVSNHPTLSYLACWNSGLTSLNAAGATALTALECGANPLLGNLNVAGATALTTLNCHNNHLSNLNIAGTTALLSLNCSNNLLSNLDITNHPTMQYLDCSNNPLSSLDVTNNIALQNLSCSNNSLSSLNVANNTALQNLYCSGNQLTMLHLSANPVLRQVFCDSNKLNYLNIKNGHNTDIIWFSALHNSNLECIQVDDWQYSSTSWNSIDSFAHFATYCPLVAVSKLAENLDIRIFPNPTSHFLTIESPILFTKYQLINTLGQVVEMKILTSNQIEMGHLPKGLYQLVLSTQSQQRKTLSVVIE